jgi:hypothetical protein
VPGDPALRGQLLVLAWPQAGGPQLVQLPAQVLLLALAAGLHALQVRQTGRCSRPLRVRAAHRLPGLQGAGESVQKERLSVCLQQQVVLVLAVEAHQRPTELPELRRRGGAAADSRSAPPPHLAGEHQLGCGVVPHPLQRRQRRGHVRDFEEGLDPGPLGALPDLLRARARSERQTEGVDDE